MAGGISGAMARAGLTTDMEKTNTRLKVRLLKRVWSSSINLAEPNVSIEMMDRCCQVE